MQKFIISGFPGVGKSKFFEHFGPAVVADSDSSKFSKDQFPQNYIKHIRSLMNQPYPVYILVSSHDTVRAALAEADIPYILVYPEKDCKTEYLRRYEQRGSSTAFLKLLNDNWDAWVEGCKTDQHAKQVIGLQPQETLESLIQEQFRYTRDHFGSRAMTPELMQRIHQLRSKYPQCPELFVCESRQESDTIQFKCPFCDRVHTHGGEDGPRSSHCANYKPNYLVLRVDKSTNDSVGLRI